MSRIVVGHHACAEVFKMRPHSIEKMWMAENWKKNPKLREFADQAGWSDIVFEEKPDRAFSELAEMTQGIALFVDETPELNYSTLGELEKSLIIAIDEVTDPHNLGAILRTAWLMGATAILTPSKRSCPMTPAAHKVASGAAEYVPVEYVSQLQQELKLLKDKGFWIYGLDHKGDKNIWQTELPEKVVWVMGSEGKGMRASTEKACDELVYLPQIDAEASYNVSVAASLAMSEYVRQQNN